MTTCGIKLATGGMDESVEGRQKKYNAGPNSLVPQPEEASEKIIDNHT